MAPSPEEELNEYLAAAWGYEGEVTADREPVDLATSKIGDERVPGGLERRAAVERLIAVVETAAGDHLALLGRPSRPWLRSCTSSPHPDSAPMPSGSSSASASSPSLPRRSARSRPRLPRPSAGDARDAARRRHRDSASGSTVHG